MDRAEWFRAVSARVIDVLPNTTRVSLRSIENLSSDAVESGCSDLGSALLVAEISRRYALASHPDDIATWIDKTMSPGSGSTLFDIVVPVCEVYRGNALPVERWWRPDELAVALLVWYVRIRLTETDVGDVMREVMLRWGITQRENVAQIFGAAQAAPPDPPDTFTGKPAGAAQRWLQKVAKLADVKREVDGRLATYPSTTFERDDLAAWVRFAATYEAIGTRLQGTSGARDPVVETAVERLQDDVTTWNALVSSLSPYERSLLHPVDERDALLGEAMSAHRKQTNIDATGVNALPDRVDGVWRSTEWLDQYVYNAGGRVLRGSAGPLARWTLVLDTLGEAAPVAQLIADGTTVALSSPATDELAILRLHVLDEPDDPMLVDFIYDAGSAEALLDLVVLVQTATARLDVFALDDDGKLAGLETVAVRIPEELSTTLRERIVPVVDSFLVDDRQQTISARSEAEQTEIASEIFLGIDASKSEQLLAAIDPRQLARPGRPTPASVAAVRAARAHVLDVRIRHAEHRHLRGDAREVVESNLDHALSDAEAAYANAVAVMRGSAKPADRTTKSQSARSRLKTLVTELVDDTSAVLHLALGRSPFDLSNELTAWSVSGHGRNLNVEKLDEQAMAVQPLLESAPIPIEGPDDLDAMFDAMPAVGRVLTDRLLEQGVRRLTICPTSFMHGVPLHCWPLAARGEDRVLDAFDRVSYAPSAAVLQRIRSSKRRRGTRVVSLSHGGDLRFAEAESRLLSTLRPSQNPSQGPATKETLRAATSDAGVLHLACHGHWFLDDIWDSGIQLSGTAASSGWLSVGELQRDVDLKGVDVVALLACESGVSTAAPWSVDRYASVDGAFLAAGARAVVSTMWDVLDAAAFLFAAGFYHALAHQATVAGAYRAATELLRSGEYRVIDSTHPIGEYIAASGVDWQQEVRDLELDGLDLTDPFFWGVFKLSGFVDDPVTALS